MVNFDLLRQTITQYEATGRQGIKVVQSKRYVNADVIAVQGRWYPVVTNIYGVAGVAVVHDTPASTDTWLDANGRAIGEYSYGD